MDDLEQRFEEQRPRLRAVAYRTLGSLSDADDAVQETWLRLSRTDADEIESLEAWLTTVVARVALNMVRSRTTRREDPLVPYVPDPVVDREDGTDPEHEALLSDAVGLALQVVLQELSAAERVAFVLHDMFSVSFDEVATVLDRSPAAARQLASRARRRVHGAVPEPDADHDRQREVVEAFFAAAREGNLEALVAVLHPDVVLRSDGGDRPGLSFALTGAETVASRALMFARLSPYVRPARINGGPGVVVLPNGRPFSIMAFTVVAGRIVAIDALSDRDRLADLDLSALAP